MPKWRRPDAGRYGLIAPPLRGSLWPGASEGARHFWRRLGRSSAAPSLPQPEGWPVYFFFFEDRLGTFTVSVTVVFGLLFAFLGLTNRPVSAERVTFLVFAITRGYEPTLVGSMT